LNAGEAKDANAKALGIPRRYTQIAVGDGGGVLPTPDRARTALVGEKRCAPINALWQDPNNASQFVAEQVIPETVGGWWIRELGLIDEDGTLCYYGNCPETYKPQMAEGSGRTQVVRMAVLNATGVPVELKIDPSIVLATRQYCDDKIAAEINKLDGKQSVRVATTAAIALAGLQTIDGVVLVAGDRVLVKNQAAATDNGIYVAAAGTWTRAADADASIEVTPGLFVPVEQGTANADSIWQLVTDAPIILGTTGLVFEMVDGKTGVTAGTYRSVMVNARGQVTGGTNPTTLAGYGITDAVTAEQGRMAGMGADLGATNGIVGDLNALNAPGEYYYRSAANANSPSAFGLLKVWRESGAIVYQLVHSSNSDLYMRYRDWNGTWRPWRQVVSQPGQISYFPVAVAPLGWLKLTVQRSAAQSLRGCTPSSARALERETVPARSTCPICVVNSFEVGMTVAAWTVLGPWALSKPLHDMSSTYKALTAQAESGRGGQTTCSMSVRGSNRSPSTTARLPGTVADWL
jgi:phage-related tail fiber protein